MARSLCQHRHALAHQGVLGPGGAWQPRSRAAGARLAVGMRRSGVSGPSVTPDRFVRGERDGEMENIYTLIPWSPTQSEAVFYSRRPTTTVSNAYQMVADEQLDDGIAFFIRTVVFNISPRLEGLRIDNDARSNLV